MATNDSDVSVYAMGMHLTAKQLQTKVAVMVDCLRNDHLAMAGMLMADIRLCIDNLAHDANKMSNDYLDDFGKRVAELFGDFHYKED